LNLAERIPLRNAQGKGMILTSYNLLNPIGYSEEVQKVTYPTSLEQSGTIY